MPQKYDTEHIENAITLWILKRMEQEGKPEYQFVKEIGMSEKGEARQFRRAKSLDKGHAWKIKHLINLINSKEIGPHTFIEEIEKIIIEFNPVVIKDEIKKIGTKKKKYQKTTN